MAVEIANGRPMQGKGLPNFSLGSLNGVTRVSRATLSHPSIDTER